MHKILATISFSALIFSSAAFPASTSNLLQQRCGPISQFYNPTPADWQTNNVNTWLTNWISNHGSEITNDVGGFAAAFGQWAIGNPDWTCRDDGSGTNCDIDVCDNRVLNDKGDDIRPAYYVLEAISRLHTYFKGLSESIQIGGIATALQKDKWALTFYEGKEDNAITALKEMFNLGGMLISIVAAFAGPAGGVVSALYTGAVGAVTPFLKDHEDDPFTRSADLGSTLGTIFVDSIKSIISKNNDLMHGDTVQGVNIQAYLANGNFVNFEGVKGVNDKPSVISRMNAFFLAKAVDLLWRQQKIFIMGGGQCGDGQGIGQGPQANSVCRDGKAWYLYYWKENDVISTTSHQWGWVVAPPGADKLNTNDYPGITVQDVINSSLDSYNVAGYNYTASTAADRAHSALSDGWRNPGLQGPSWEGTFTIPVCDVGGAITADYHGKEYILQDYGHDSRPVWCGPVCNGDIQKTRDFIKASKMDGFQSPKHLCDPDPGVLRCLS